jgi:hypothetical protein
MKSRPVAAKIYSQWNAKPMANKRNMYNHNMNLIRMYQAGELTPALRTPNQEKALVEHAKKLINDMKRESRTEFLSRPESRPIMSEAEHATMFKPNKWFGSIPLNSHERLGAALNHLDHHNIHFQRMLSAAKAYHKKLGLGNGVANNAPVNIKRGFIKSVARNHLKFFRTMNSLKNESQKRAFLAMTPANRIRHLAARAGPVPRGVVPHWNT